MTDRELMQQALDALEKSRVFVTSREKIKHPEGTEWYDERVEAIRARLAQPEQDSDIQAALKSDNWAIQAVAMAALHKKHTAPPQREWQGLTDEEIEQVIDAHWNDPSMFVEAIEAKLKEKNT